MDSEQKSSGASSQSAFKFFIGQDISGQVANQFASPYLVLPWVFVTIGGPHFLTALILPINQAGSFISQLMAGTVLASFPLRKWIVLALNIAIGVLLILVSTTTMHLPLTWTLILFLPMTLALGLCSGIKSVAIQDLMAKTFNREEMGKLLSLGNSLGGVLILVLAAITHFSNPNPESMHNHLVTIWMGATLFVVSGLFLFGILEKESPVHVEKKPKFNFSEGLLLVKNSPWFLKFLVLKTLCVSVVLVLPFFSIHTTTLHKNSASTLSVFIFATALGALVSKPFWDPLQKREMRFQFSLAAALAGVAAFYSLVIEFFPALQTPYYHAPAFFLAMLANNGFSIACVIYFNDNVSEEDRPKYLGINGAIMSVVGIAGCFLIGILATMTHIKFSLMVLILLNILAGLYSYFSSSFSVAK